MAYADGRVCFATRGRVLVGFWRAPFSDERLRKLRELALALRAERSGPLGMLAVFESDAIQLSALADESLRRKGAQLQSEFAEIFGSHQSVVLEGTGFAVAALRGAALTLQAIARAGQRYVFHADARAGIAFLSSGLRLAPADAGELARTLDEMRAANIAACM